MITAMLLVSALSVKEIGRQPVILNGSGDISAAQYLFVSSAFGLCALDQETGIWTRISATSGLPDDHVRVLGLDEGILWVATDSGLASADIQVNDWQSYKVPGAINSLAFDEEYVWVAGDSGLSRFDKYDERWKMIAPFRVHDMYSEGEFIWCACDSGVMLYNRVFEKFEAAPGAPPGIFERIVTTPSSIWFLSGQTYGRYVRDADAWLAYPGRDMSDYATAGDSLFIVSAGQLYFFDPNVNAWTQYRELEDLAGINGVWAQPDGLLLAMPTGLIQYGFTERMRKHYSKANGMASDSLIDAYQDPGSGTIYSISLQDIEFLDRSTGIWNVQVLTPGGSRARRIFFYDEKGAHLSPSRGLDLRLQGRAYYSRTMTSVTQTDDETVNLRLITSHASGRLLSVYYDDNDPDLLMYGIGYRGLDRDVLYRMDGGYLNTEYFEFDRVPQFSGLGASVKSRLGPHGVDAQAGLLKSHLHTQFFCGTSVARADTVDDRTYLRSFYRIHDSEQAVEKGSDTIFVDDLNDATNQFGTRTDLNLGGVIGDYDLLMNGIDYMVDYDRGIVYFLSSRSDREVIIMKLNGDVIVIQPDSVAAHRLENRYRLGMSIVPGSLDLRIFDTTGVLHPLDEFGIDNDGDGRVDPAFINYELGILRFPQSRPFPAGVYVDSAHVYDLVIDYVSYSTYYDLNSAPMVRGSEEVIVDGSVMNRGTDYIVDYTSGSLLFLKPQLVSDFSQIQVRYSSLARDRKDPYWSVQPRVSVGRGADIAPGIARIDDVAYGFITGAYESAIGENGKAKLVPQVAFDDSLNCAQSYALVGTYGIANASARYEGYSERFEDFGAGARQYGALRHRGALMTSIEPLRFLKIDAALDQSSQEGDSNLVNTVRYTTGKVSYNKPAFLNGYLMLADSRVPLFDKRTVQVGTSGTFERIRTRLNFDAMAHNDVFNMNDHSENLVRGCALSGNFVLPMPLYGNLYVQERRQYGDGTKTMRESDVRGGLNFDMIPGAYYVGTYMLQEKEYFTRSTQDILLKGTAINNLNIAPGRWFSAFSVVNFSLGTTRSFSEYLEDLGAGFTRPLVVVSPLEDGFISSVSSLVGYYASAQYMPLSNIMVWLKHTLSHSGQAYFSTPLARMTIMEQVKVEYELRTLGLFTVSGDYTMARDYPRRTVRTACGEWTKPWTPAVQTKLTVNFQDRVEAYGLAERDISTLFAGNEFLLRIGSKSYVTMRGYGRRQVDYDDSTSYYITPGAGCNLNLLTCFYVQADYALSYLLHGAVSHVVSMKVTGQF